MTGCYDLHGIVPIINTPFDEKLNIDVPSLERLIEQSITDGIVGCIVPAVASEVEKLSLRERKFLVEQVASIAGRRIKVIAGVSSEEIKDAIGLAENALHLGCDGILCRVPDKLEADHQGIVRFFQELSSVGMEMLMIQDLSWNGYGMSLKTIFEMFKKISAFKCIKIETIPAGFKSSQVLAETKGELNVSSGWSLPEMIEALDRGIHGFNTTAINKPFVHIYRLHTGGNRFKAIKLFEEIVPFLAWTHQHIDISIQFLKRYCYTKGIFSTFNVRQPILPFDQYHDRCSEELIRNIISCETRLT
ncbi:MAG: dihydrodipicolinate synthase family protein [Acidobacteriia bacterium]|jgi:4-hydroxy-tetrahydrodipicolinate synthase|nr:dihydrodipicolinate synthase family protein [Terriglobia bacterium]